MENQHWNATYFRTQFNSYWPRVQRTIMPMIERIEAAARQYFNSGKTSNHAKRRPAKARKASARRPRKAHA